MKRLTGLCALLAAGVLTMAPFALAHQSHRHHPPVHRSAPSFAGECRFSGEVGFDPPLTNTPQPVRDSAAARGSCSGTFTSGRGRTHRLTGQSVAYQAADQGDAVSCGGGVSSGAGQLVFPWGRIQFRLSEARAGAGAALSLQGTAGGSAAGDATISADEDPLAILTRCATGGLPRVGVDINIATTSPISG